MDDRAIYLKQLELGPMQNFVYLVGDPVARQCVVVDPAWEIDSIVETAAQSWSASRSVTTVISQPT